MLGQHPQLYGFPEINLFVADTISELWHLSNSPVPGGPSYITGILRVIAQLEFGGQTDETIHRAREWLSSRLHWKTKQMLDRLLDWIHPKIGVDKSPRTSLSQRSIDRALSACPQSRIIHLTRHPVSTLHSLQENHQRSAPRHGSSADQVWLLNFYARLWIQSQEIILSTVHKLGSSQAIQIRAEDLLFQPDIHLARLTQWLEVGSDLLAIQAMKYPERSPYSRPAPMGLEGDGDPHFLQSPQLRPITAPESHRVPRDWKLESSLASKANDLSRRLGYGAIL